ncbi:hypothetical protein [Salinarimonas sp.]|uniref:hypothetical protein n=1 Tax=Salinarimonas sp. TaxID=2766526 RepID=UPI00391AFB54
MTRHRLLAPIALLAAALAWLLLADSHAGDPPVRLFVLPSEGPVVAHLVLPVCPHGACPGSTALMHYTEHLAWLSAVGREAP